MSFVYTLLLGFAVSLDAFTAGVAYGMRNISVPLSSLTVVGTVTAVCVAASMLAATLLGQFLDLRVAVAAGSLLMIMLGILSLFQEYLARKVSAYEIPGEFSPRQLTFSVGRLVISIMAKPETADVDRSLSISWFEAVFLGLALGLDNIVATFAASLMGMLPLYTPLLMAVTQMLFIAAGNWASAHVLSPDMKKQFPFIPGTILVILGILRLR